MYEKDRNREDQLLKTEIENIKKNLAHVPEVMEIRNELKYVECSINSAISETSQNLLDKIVQMNKTKQKELDKIRQELQNELKSTFSCLEDQIRKIEDQLSFKKDEDTSSTVSLDGLQSSKRAFIGDPILLKISKTCLVTRGQETN